MIATADHISPVPDQVENIKDTIESLIIAFILAFVFRGFLVEAFVIPTGSMAPTLNGVHGTQICPSCGWQYTYGLPESRPERRAIKCPNCGTRSAHHEEMPYHKSDKSCKLYRDRLDGGLARRNPRLAEKLPHLSFAPQSGDRILVFKWPFALGGRRFGPQPWDVIVFKNPTNGQDNYIKRLVGVPNEVLEIIDGDLYTCALSDLDSDVIEHLNSVVDIKKDLKYPQRNNSYRRYDKLRPLQSWIAGALNDKLAIRRKTAVAQKALWQVAYRQDYLPAKAQSDKPTWRVTSSKDNHRSWDTTSRILRFDGEDREESTIELLGKRFTDFYAYNFKGDEPRRPLWVGDLRLSFVLAYHGGDGALTLVLSKNNDVFLADLSADGRIELKHMTQGQPQSMRTLQSIQLPAWDPGQHLQVEFANVDYQVYLKLSGKTDPVLETTDEDYAPDIRLLREESSHNSKKRPRVKFSAEHLKIELKHVAIDRDIYYQSNKRDGQPGWGVTGSPIMLREDEYFVLGDNSPASQDSRLWQVVGPHLGGREGYQLGTVSADQLIGKAFFVYWPSGHRINWLPVFKDFGLIPNVGEMRWIR